MLSLVKKDVLVKLFYKIAESSSLAFLAYRSMNGMRDGKGPMTCSALTKMMLKFEATSSLSSRPRSGRPTASATLVPTVEQNMQSMSAVSAHGVCCDREISRQTGLSYRSVWIAL
ncbi:hypothetical protein HNY73_002349 [Argiope bruennichi]|uniref:DUF4817 domain-containing protein n=1 Tax=Argiope bruennichi TaxID=94029 RepID=A0A8T0FXM7_ARGBR|nr:hypothetical protein HNY73_002349 [Argiope bruennichi]